MTGTFGWVMMVVSGVSFFIYVNARMCDEIGT